MGISARTTRIGTIIAAIFAPKLSPESAGTAAATEVAGGVIETVTVTREDDMEEEVVRRGVAEGGLDTIITCIPLVESVV